MELSELTELISPIILFACLIVGYLIKNCIPNEKINRYIPIIVCLLGMIANVWATGIFDIYTLVGGAISGLASTGLYEVFDQLLGKDDKEKEE